MRPPVTSIPTTQDLSAEMVAMFGRAARFDLALLDAAVRAWSDNTRRAFRSDLMLWWRWCRRRQVEPGQAQPSDVARWIRELAAGEDGEGKPDAAQPCFDDETQSWAAPFVMAEINVKNVHRTNLLLGHPWGPDFVYDEMILTGAGERGEALARRIAETPMIGGPDDPEPGEGPSEEERKSGHYDLLFSGTWPDGRVLRFGVKGRYDPGYGSTCRMLTETGMALLSSDAPGGIGTPGSILGEALVQRLRDNADMTFEAENE